MIIDLNVKCKAIKLLENNIGENLDDLGYGDMFLDKLPRIHSTKEIIDKLNFIKIKNMCCEVNVKRIRREATHCEKIFADDSFFIKNE